jgi:predicted alpha/beta-fold hydrolase
VSTILPDKEVESDMRILTAAALGASALLAANWTTRHPRAAARKPKLDFNPSSFNKSVVARIDQLRRPYVQTPWLFNAHLQVLWLLLHESLAPALRYERTDLLRMRDGGTTALDWIGLDEPASTPTLLVLPGITGDAQSMRSIVRDLRRATGWRIVVCTRRGHGDLELTSPLFNTMGSTEDLREQLAHIRAQVPRSTLYAVGVSAGSAVLVRYLGEEGSRSSIRAGVAYCPGYDMRVAWNHVPAPYNRLMARRLKKYFLSRHADSLQHLDTYDACMAARDLAGFHEQLYQMAGCADPMDYLQRTNPVLVMEDVAVPVMIINALDDPVCVAANARDHVGAVRRVRDALLVRTARGSHCAFHEGWSARSWSNRLMASYLLLANEQIGASAQRAARRVHAGSTRRTAPQTAS